MHFLIILQIIISAITLNQVTIIDYETENINDIVYEDLTYREIFVTNDMHSFTNNSPYTAYANSLLDGLAPQLTPYEDYYFVSRVKILADVYSAAYGSHAILGDNNPLQTSQIYNDGQYHTRSNIFHIEGTYTNNSLWVYGSSDNTFREVWIDYIKVIPMSIFTTQPTQEQMDTMLERYLELKETPHVHAEVIAIEIQHVFLIFAFSAMWVAIYKLVKGVF